MSDRDKAAVLRGKRNARKRDAVFEARDRRRFTEAPIPSGIVSRLADPGATGTQYPDTVLEWSPGLGETILKDGAHNSKIGGDVRIGRLRGARIFTLALEERATCPRSCRLWVECYGNNLNRTRRWRAGAALEQGLEAEVRHLCAQHATVLVRLHVLGDFYSWKYLALWAALLDDHPNLHVFGFTAHRPGTKIGDGIKRLRDALPDRFAMRVSESAGPWTSMTLDFPTTLKRIGDAIVCPEQRHAIDAPKRRTHCGSCALCWQTDAPIAFIRH